jgi:hypothetical protein
MAVYKLFPTKDSSIYSYYPNKNAGLDEILDISVYKSIEETGEVARALLSFDNNEIYDVLTNKINSADYKTYLKLYLANATEIPTDYTLYCYSISGSWNMGTGRASNNPETTDGVSWEYSNYISGSIFTASISGYASYYPNHNPGGGSWYSSDYLISTQSFNCLSNRDIELDVTQNIYSGTYNNGFIIRHSNNLEFLTGSLFELKYFSSNSHTIYPPCLEFRWDDFNYNTGSLTTTSSPNVIISLSNNLGEFSSDAVNRFRINVRDKYPTRVFQTSSLYLNNKLLPTSSYYAVKDIKTDELVIDFDTTYTKLSADTLGNYFDLYMNGLQPERYYKILVKTIIEGSTIISEDNNYFKITQ